MVLYTYKRLTRKINMYQRKMLKLATMQKKSINNTYSSCIQQKSSVSTFLKPKQPNIFSPLQRVEDEEETLAI